MVKPVKVLHLSLLNFSLIWGAPFFFLPKIKFWLMCGKIFHLSQNFIGLKITLKIWDKSELVEFLPNFGCPPLFCLKLRFGLGGVKVFTSNHNLSLA